MHQIRRWKPVLTAAVMCTASSARGQLVSVQCCTEEYHLDGVYDCLSGEGNDSTTRPDTCGYGATCVLGFGPDSSLNILRTSLCDPTAPVIPDPTRAHCSAWSGEDAPVSFQCVARSELASDPFIVIDDDGDGDLDEEDVAVFEKIRGIVPKLEQTRAMLTFVECCVPPDLYRLSGPDAVATPLRTRCLAGFSERVEPGDYLYSLCGSPPADPFLPLVSMCASWQLDATPSPSGFFCPAADFVHQSFTVVADTDGDTDADLLDYAAYQRDIFE